MEATELWNEMRNVLDPNLDGHPAELLRWLDDEAFPEQMALGWVRRLALLIPEQATPLATILRQAEAELQFRTEQLSHLRAEGTRELGDSSQQEFSARDLDTNGLKHSDWYAWLRSDERFRILDHKLIDYDSPSNLELNAASAENEVTEELMFWIGRCLDVLPPHLQNLKASLVSFRRELSRRNHDLTLTFGPMF